MTELERLLKAKIPCPETGIEIRHTICDICTPGPQCGIDAYIKDGKVIKIEGTDGFPTNNGVLCTKGAANRQYIYREDRLKTPMKRVGKRGEGKFEPISWDVEALILDSRDMNIFCGYSLSTWGALEEAAAIYLDAYWNGEYIPAVPLLLADE